MVDSKTLPLYKNNRTRVFQWQPLFLTGFATCNISPCVVCFGFDAWSVSDNLTVNADDQLFKILKGNCQNSILKILHGILTTTFAQWEVNKMSINPQNSHLVKIKHKARVDDEQEHNKFIECTRSVSDTNMASHGIDQNWGDQLWKIS